MEFQSLVVEETAGISPRCESELTKLTVLLKSRSYCGVTSELDAYIFVRQRI